MCSGIHLSDMYYPTEGNGTSGIVSGLLSTMDDVHPDNRFQHTAPIQGGNSGGPVMDTGGNGVGGCRE